MKSPACMRKFLPLLLLGLIFTSCEEKDKTGENPAPDTKNAVTRLSLLYDGMGFHADSAITNNLGQKFFIENVALVFSNTYFREGSDTVAFRGEPFVLSSTKVNNAVLEIPPGGYSAYYAMRLGLDSAANADIAVNGIPADSELRDADVLRPDGNGIDHLIITGRVIDPTDPTDSTGNINLSYRIGTTELSRTYASLQKNFSVQGSGKISMVLRVDLAPALQDMDLASKPVIITDPQNLVDYNLAIQIANNLKVELF